MIVHVAGLVFFQLSEPELLAKRGVPPKVLLTRINQEVDQVLKEQLQLFDNKPLFLPTKWNYANSENFSVKDSRLVEVFKTEAPSFFPSEGVFESFSQVSGDIIENPDDVLKGVNGSYLRALGQRDEPVKPVSTRMAAIEVYSTRAGSIVYSEEVGLREERLGDFSHQGLLWMPVEFLILIDITGAIGRPLLTASSGSEEIDDFFRDFISEELNLAKKIDPGYYRILIGP
ncbi:MAG: hypothetical protein JKY51_05385 [Opitutaceae bacterium]|nr:hypothetical protein [Opitutaceae bacterium]